MNNNYRIAIHYEYLCETFDRSLPGYYSRGDWIPYDMHKCGKNAEKVMWDLINHPDYKKENYTKESFLDCIRHLRPMGYHEVCRLAKRLGIIGFNLEI